MDFTPEINTKKPSRGIAAFHLAFNPFASGTAGRLLLSATAELIGLTLLLWGIQLGLEEVFPNKLCTNSCAQGSVFCCFSNLPSLAWVLSSLMALWLWSFVSCTIRANSLVHISLLNALVMLCLLIYSFFSNLDWFSLAVLECLVFFTMFSSYKRSFRHKSRK